MPVGQQNPTLFLRSATRESSQRTPARTSGTHKRLKRHHRIMRCRSLLPMEPDSCQQMSSRTGLT